MLFALIFNFKTLNLGKFSSDQEMILPCYFTPFVADEVQPAKQGEKYVNLSEPHTGLI